MIVSNPAIIRSVVVLPHPDGPTRARNSLCGCSSSRSSDSLRLVVIHLAEIPQQNACHSVSCLLRQHSHDACYDPRPPIQLPPHGISRCLTGRCEGMCLRVPSVAGHPARVHIPVDGRRICGRMSLPAQIEYGVVRQRRHLLFLCVECAQRRRPRKMIEIGFSFARSQDCRSLQSEAAICASIEIRLRSPRVTPCLPGVSSRAPSATRSMRSCSPTSLKDAMLKAASCQPKPPWRTHFRCQLPGHPAQVGAAARRWIDEPRQGRQVRACPEPPCQRAAPLCADRQHRRHPALLRVPHRRGADGGASGRIPPGRCRPRRSRRHSARCAMQSRWGPVASRPTLPFTRRSQKPRATPDSTTLNH